MSAPVVAVDVGGTRIKAAVVRDGRADETLVLPVADDSPVLDQVTAVITSLSAEVGAFGLGVCVPGLVDVDSGVVRSLEGKLADLDGTDVAALLAERVGVVPVVTNDAVAFGIGEAVHGAGADVERVVVVTIGTGVGVSLVDRSLPVEHWLRSRAVLGGFIPISAATTGPFDSTGRPGSIEALCCAARIVDSPTYRDDLVRALVALAHAHMPEVIVVGGGPLRLAGTLLDGVEERVNQRLYAGYSLSVRRASLGDSAALVGIAVVAEWG